MMEKRFTNMIASEVKTTPGKTISHGASYLYNSKQN